MKRRGPSSFARLLRVSSRAAFGLIAIVPIPSVARDDAFPFPVRVQVLEEGTVAPDRSLRLLEGAILIELRRCGCSLNATAGISEAGANVVVLRVILKELIEEARWDMQTADRAEAVRQGNEAALAPTTTIRARGQAQVLAGPQRALAKTRAITVAAEWTTKAPGMDPAEQAREHALNKFAVEARKTLCKSRRKLLASIDALTPH